MKVHVLFSEWTRCSDGGSAVVHGVFASHAAALAEARAVMAQYEGWGHTCYGTCIPDREPKGDHWTFDLYIEEHEVLSTAATFDP